MAGWHREDIKAELRKRCGSITLLALSWGYHRASISNALAHGDRPAVEKRIAEVLGVSPHTLWPDRWAPDGARRPKAASNANPSRSALPAHRQKLEAA